MFAKRPPIGGLFVKRLRQVGSAQGSFARIGVDGGGLVLNRPGLGGGGAAAAGGFLEAVAVTVHGEDADVVGEPVQWRAGQPSAG